VKLFSESYLRKIGGVSCFGRTRRKFKQNCAFDWTCFETFPTLLTKIQNDSRLPFVQCNDTWWASPGASSTAVAPVSIDPGI